MKKTALNAALATVLGFAAIGAQAAAVNNGDSMNITGATTPSGAYVSGSYFAMDTNGNAKIAATEKTALSTGSVGIVIGNTTTAGASHSGAPTAGDTGTIDAPWGFFGNTGTDFNVVAITGSTTAGLNMSGWRVSWNGIPSINMGGGAWATGTGTGHTGATGTFVSGVGNFTWSGVYGTAYTLNYRATVPIGDPSGFGGVKYELHLEGIVTAAPPAVPVPAAAWLFGSGLMGLVGVARRKANKA